MSTANNYIVGKKMFMINDKIKGFSMIMLD